MPRYIELVCSHGDMKQLEGDKLHIALLADDTDETGRVQPGGCRLRQCEIRSPLSADECHQDLTD